MKTIFGIDMNLDGKTTTVDDLLFAAMMEENKPRDKEDDLDWVDELETLDAILDD